MYDVIDWNQNSRRSQIALISSSVCAGRKEERREGKKCGVRRTNDQKREEERGSPAPPHY
jgi:hypothetical protein